MHILWIDIYIYVCVSICTYLYIYIHVWIWRLIERNMERTFCIRVCCHSYYINAELPQEFKQNDSTIFDKTGNSAWLAGSAFCLYGCIKVLFLLAFNEFAWISLTPTEPTQEQAEQSLQDSRSCVFSCKWCFNLASSELLPSNEAV